MLTLTIAMALGKSEVNKVGGGWTCPQIISLAIFLVMLYTWITENNLILQLNGSYLLEMGRISGTSRLLKPTRDPF